jgi:CheY-like chemotaxis protein
MAIKVQIPIEQFRFQTQEELPPQLIQAVEGGACGYWRHQFDRLSGQPKPLYWYVAIANGKILYAGGRYWSVAALFSILHRYCPSLRSAVNQEKFNKLRSYAQSLEIKEAWKLLQRSNLVTEEQLISALHLKCLNDFDTYFSIGSGIAEFIPDDTICETIPSEGLSVHRIVDEFHSRQLIWTKVTSFVPSMSLLPTIDRPILDKFNLPAAQVKKIEEVVKPGRNLKNIAEGMGKDSLEVAQMFAQLVMKKIVTLEPPESDRDRPTVMIVDDSPLILKQFQKLVSVLGYSVVICQDPSIAVSMIWKVHPAMIFIDINMPGISGFELVKQIRKHAQLKDIPIAILTGEQKHSNKWRAEWSNCEFLTKPLLSNELGDFQNRLQEMLNKFVQLDGSNHPDPSSN